MRIYGTVALDINHHRGRILPNIQSTNTIVVDNDAALQHEHLQKRLRDILNVQRDGGRYESLQLALGIGVGREGLSMVMDRFEARRVNVLKSIPGPLS
ncbi:hypothetical protein HYPSUDRAFT_441503 [Hypholoma sublateritium FD-334 SS-4]|uniref:Uncharacterized protein n=1 Tax=Hypholoma sublateritium (strain FD-334 SS-4) TaxID=945553 RepID=A0A0D2P2T2_HYPSF|nr:hypothetical protein HYPSUDRAFT_441503 [Hypholoma sublateritium FD-334 SS-4]